jgi:hypothetical protein
LDARGLLSRRAVEGIVPAPQQAQDFAEIPAIVPVGPRQTAPDALLNQEHICHKVSPMSAARAQIQPALLVTFAVR